MQGQLLLFHTDADYSGSERKWVPLGLFYRSDRSHLDVIGVQTSLGEQLLDVPVRQGKTQIPTNRQKNDFRFELSPLEQTGNR